MKNSKVTKYLKLPFQFDEKRLLYDLELIKNQKWIPHFNQDGYEGNWKIIALYAKNGDASNVYEITSSANEISETQLLKGCSYLKEVIAKFECPLFSVRLLRLGKGAKIKPHRDNQLGYEDNNFRLHIPIITNDKVDFVLDGMRMEMLPGECWYTNVNFIHSVENNGDSDRIHLVIDGERNAWSDELFFSLAPRESFFPKKEDTYSRETLLQMIKELEQLNEPAAIQLITQFKEQLNKME